MSAERARVAKDALPALPDPRWVRTARRALLDWYAEHGRDLPWRRTRDPYAIWISEAMLQQTRVEAVIGYWGRFLERFPDVERLAAAGEEELLAAWSGLGYYRRARALADAARVIVERHGGCFPRDREGALALPGVGPYTAGAVLSIAYDEPESVVDGNVARVFSRLFELDAPAESSALKRHLWALADLLVRGGGGADARPGDWNQAVMELGATVCTPRNPTCDACPWRRRCRARAAGRVDELPRPAVQAAAIDVVLEIALALDGERVLLTKRPAKGRMAGMWELPTREVGSRALWPEAFPEGAELELDDELGEVRHGITKHRIRARVRAAAWSGAGRPDAPLAWRALDEARSSGVTGITRKVLARFAERS